MKKMYILIIIVLGLATVACTPNASAPPAGNINGIEWQLLFIRKSTPLAGSVTTISFNEGEVSGRSGCNSYFGSYELSGSMITFGQLAMTEMACMEPEGIMEQEQEYLAFLSEVVSFSIDDGQLALKKETQDQLTFETIDEQ